MMCRRVYVCSGGAGACEEKSKIQTAAVWGDNFRVKLYVVHVHVSTSNLCVHRGGKQGGRRI